MVFTSTFQLFNLNSRFLQNVRFFSVIYQQETQSIDPNFPQEKYLIIYSAITMVNE